MENEIVCQEEKITTRYEGFSSIGDNDYQMKSCILGEICQSTTSACYIVVDD
jgi:hypothetical protein